jgi:transposase InsO family protein
VRSANWIDLYSRRVVGWAMGATMEATLVLEALNRALGHRQIESDQLLVHTDQGSQYRATAYRQLLENHKISCSMSTKGCCWDNAVVESFFSTLKHELALDDDAEILNSPQQLIRHWAFWIDGYYNRERRHSTIGYLSPIDYEQQYGLRPISSTSIPVHSSAQSPDTCPMNRGNPRVLGSRTLFFCGRHHVLAGLGDVAEQVAQEMHPATLP